MKKMLLFISFSVLIMVSLTSCRAKPYSFKEPIDEIERIEIVSAESSLEFTVIKTLSETEEKDFLEEFQKLNFKRYLGDPSGVHGDAIKITYRSGLYEMICFFTAEYVENGKIQFLWKSCDEKVFNDLLASFLEEASS